MAVVIPKQSVPFSDGVVDDKNSPALFDKTWWLAFNSAFDLINSINGGGNVGASVNMEDIALTGTTAITPTTAVGVGKLLCLFLTQDATGGRLSTWSPTIFRWPPVGLNTHASTITMVWFVGHVDPADSVTKWWTLPFHRNGASMRLALLLAACVSLHAQPTTTGAPLTTSVSDFGAVGDGTTDDAAAINAALSFLPASGGVVALAQSSVYAIHSTLTIPASNVILDCNGSQIVYTPATGDAIHILPFASDVPYISGGMRNCWISASASTSNKGIHQESRLGFFYENLRTSGLNGATAACMEWEKSPTSPQFTEQTRVARWDSFDCTEHLKLIKNGGTNSFAYNDLREWHCTLGAANSGCLMADGSGANSILLFGNSIHLRVNANGTGPFYTVKLTSGSVLERQSITLLGELTSGAGPLYSIWTDASSELYAPGEVNITGSSVLFGGSGQTSASVPLPIDPITGVAGWWAGGGILPQRKCKYGAGWPNTTSGNGGDWKAYLASYGGTEDNCAFQIVKRATDATNVDVNVQGSGTAEVNVMFADALSGKVGFGPLFGWGANPQYHVDALGASMRTPNILQMGNSLGMHRNYIGTDADESFQLLVPAGLASASFSFFTVFGNPPNCVATPNTTLISTGANPKIGSYAISAAVNGMTIVQLMLDINTGTTVAASFDVSYFVHCTANGN